MPTMTAMGMALHLQFERPVGGALLHAHQDTAGYWQIGDGITTLANGDPVTEGVTMTPGEYQMLANKTMRKFELGVDELITVPITRYQFDACVNLAYNIGLGAFDGSSVLTSINAERFSDAAYHFGDWVYAKVHNNFDDDGNVIGDAKFGPDGLLLEEDVVWMRAYRGLYRRHLSEACLSLGYDWQVACADEAIELDTNPVWEESRNRWKDVVTYKTPWADVLAVAKQYPLAPAVMHKTGEPARVPSIAVLEAVKPADAPRAKPATPPKPVDVQIRDVRDVAPNADPAAPLKRMENSQTFKGLFALMNGYAGRYISAIGVFGAGTSQIVADFIKEPEVIALCAATLLLVITNWKAMSRKVQHLEEIVLVSLASVGLVACLLRFVEMPWARTLVLAAVVGLAVSQVLILWGRRTASEGRTTASQGKI